MKSPGQDDKVMVGANGFEGGRTENCKVRVFWDFSNLGSPAFGSQKKFVRNHRFCQVSEQNAGLFNYVEREFPQIMH